MAINIKKTSSVICLIIILLSALTITAFSYYNTRETAIEITPNVLVEGCGYEGGSPHWYKFNVPSDGYINIEFEHVPFEDNDEYWAIALYDSKGEKIHHPWIVFYNDTVENNSDNVGISAGTYYIAIYGLNSYGGVPYTFTINYNSANNWEAESNNEEKNAKLISVNKKYNGSLSSNYKDKMTGLNSYDEDWYYFTVNESGKVNVEFNHEITSSTTNCWQIALYSLDVNSSNEYLLDLDIIGERLEPTSWDDYSYFFPGNKNGVTCSYGLSAGTYYLRIAKPTDALYEGKSYDFKINYESADDWENENSNDIHPNYIDIGNTYKGAVITESDNDWYQFELNSKCDITIEFNHDTLDTNEKCWKVTLYRGRWNTASEVVTFESYGNKATTSSNKLTCEQGTYSLVVEASNSFSDVDYSFNITAAHDCAGSLITTKQATCTEDGKKENTCNFCGKLLESQTIPATGHSYGEWVVDTNATCSMLGKKHSTCATCNTTIYEDISMVAHTYDTWVTIKNPTCSAKGQKQTTCKVCKNVVYEEIATTSHNMGAWNVVQSPTCFDVGTQTRKCNNCSYVETQTLQPQGHQFEDWKPIEEATCYAAGHASRECKLCGTTEEQILEQTTHKYSDWKILSGNKLIPPIVKESSCVYCGLVKNVKDWSNIWISILAILGTVGIAFGVVNYIRAYKKH